MLDPVKRTARGIEVRLEVLGEPTPEPATPVQASWRDYVYSEVWSRPGLDLRSRYIISIVSAANAGDGEATAAYVKGALSRSGMTLAELREAALHAAVYSGWSCGQLMDDSVTLAASALGMAAADFAPIRAQPWTAEDRYHEGGESFAHNMVFPAPPPKTAYFEGGILNFVFAEMWNRPGLDQRARRWVTLVGVGNASASTPIRSHVWSALKSGNATVDEMYEFVLQYGIHAGWPKASVMQGAVMEQSANVAKGLTYDGQTPGAPR